MAMAFAAVQPNRWWRIFLPCAVTLTGLGIFYFGLGSMIEYLTQAGFGNPTQSAAIVSEVSSLRALCMLLFNLSAGSYFSSGPPFRWLLLGYLSVVLSCVLAVVSVYTRHAWIYWLGFGPVLGVGTAIAYTISYQIAMVTLTLTLTLTSNPY